MIELQNVTLRFGRQEALRDLSFTLKENTICGVWGRNGAGKTSLLSLLASYRRPTSGNVRLWGENPYENRKIMQDVALVYDRAGTDDGQRVKDWLALARLRPDWDEKTARRLLDLFGVPVKKSVSKLSHGMRSALWVSIGIASRAPLTIYDEAYLGMDAANRSLFLRELLADYARAPRTILFSTHYITEAEKALEKVLVLDGGRLLALEDCDALRRKAVTLCGAPTAAEAFASGRRVLSERAFGGQKEFVLLCELSEAERSEAARLGLSVSQTPLQDMFICMTGGFHDETQYDV